jgi:hypothetical protein
MSDEHRAVTKEKATRTIRLESWAEFASRIAALREERKDPLGSHRSEWIFRGVSDARYALSSTLERTKEFGERMPVDRYLEDIHSIQDQLKSLTGKNWKHVTKGVSTQYYQGKRFTHDYSYMTYLRHHGYPSPFLDWSASHFIAAFLRISRTSTLNRRA